jgi:peroxiredoxin
MTAPIQPGERAPQFSLPAINREGVVSDADYRGRALMIGFFRGLHCPFCRRQIAQLGAAQPSLAALGVESVAVINTPVERARLYFRYRPTPVTLLSDPECETHRGFGIPRIEFLPPGGPAGKWPRARPEDFATARIDPTGELGAPTQPMEANTVLNRKDGFQLTAADNENLRKTRHAIRGPVPDRPRGHRALELDRGAAFSQRAVPLSRRSGDARGCAQAARLIAVMK